MSMANFCRIKKNTKVTVWRNRAVLVLTCSSCEPIKGNNLPQAVQGDQKKKLRAPGSLLFPTARTRREEKRSWERGWWTRRLALHALSIPFFPLNRHSVGVVDPVRLLTCSLTLWGTIFPLGDCERPSTSYRTIKWATYNKTVQLIAPVVNQNNHIWLIWQT